MIGEIIDQWLMKQTARPNIASSTVRTLNTRVARMKEAIGSNPQFDSATLNLIWKMPTSYAYTHRIAKTFVWISQWAKNQGLIHINPISNEKFKQPNYEHKKISLSTYEVELLVNAKLVGTLAVVRDLFLLQCRTGWSFAELQNIHKAVVYESCGRTWIKLTRVKTGKPCPVPCGEEIMSLMRAHNWNPKVPCNQIYNRYLKIMAQRVGIQKRITSHVARKTFAQTWLDRGATPFVVSQMMGNTERILMKHYGGVTEQTLDKALTQIGL